MSVSSWLLSVALAVIWHISVSIGKGGMVWSRRWRVSATWQLQSWFAEAATAPIIH